jgi:hypothetical protein
MVGDLTLSVIPLKPRQFACLSTPEPLTAALSGLEKSIEKLAKNIRFQTKKAPLSGAFFSG